MDHTPGDEMMPAATTETNPRKRISLKKAEEEKQEAVAAALAKEREKWEAEQEERQAEEGFGFTDEDPENPEYFGSEEEIEEEEGGFDIFQYTQKEFEEKGKPVLYYIKKDNQVLGQLPAPCDWTDLQNKWGGGIYQVIARHALTKRYIKTQTERVAEPIRTEPKETVAAPAPPPPAPSPDMNLMFDGITSAFMKMQEMSTREKNREERDEKKSSEAFNTTFLTLMQAQQKSTTDMMLQIAKMSNDNTKAQTDSFSRVIEKMDDKFTRMFDKLADMGNKKEEGINTVELIKMMNDSRSEGMSTMETVMELAQGFAESSAPVDSKESMLGSLVKGMLPILTNANKSIEAANHQRRPLPPGQVPAGPIPLAQPQRPGVPTSPHGQGAQVRAPHQQVNRPGPGGHGQIFTAQTLGLPTFADTVNSAGHTGPTGKQPVRPNHPAPPEAPVVAGVRKSANTVVPPTEQQHSEAVIVNKPRVEDVNQNDLYEKASIAQRTIAELAIPPITAHLFDDNITPEESAKIILGELWGQGFTPEVVCREFTIDYMLQIAGTFGVGEEKRKWFEEFYATVQDAAGARDSRGPEPTAN